MIEYMLVVNGLTILVTGDEREAQIILGQINFHNDFVSYDCDRSCEGLVIWRVSMDVEKAKAA